MSIYRRCLNKQYIYTMKYYAAEYYAVVKEVYTLPWSEKEQCK